MLLADIRKKLAYNPNAQPTQKQATRTWLNSIHKDYPLAITLTLKQYVEVENENGVYYTKLDKDDIKRVAKHFTHKHLHLHMAIGGLPAYVKWNEVDTLVRNAKLSIKELDEQHKVDITDSGWMEYITKELGMNDTDNVLWDLA